MDLTPPENYSRAEFHTLRERLSGSIESILNNWSNSEENITLLSPVTINGVEYTHQKAKVIAGALRNGITSKSLLIGINKNPQKDPVDTKLLKNMEDKRCAALIFSPDWWIRVQENQEQYIKEALVDLFNFDMQCAAEGIQLQDHGMEGNKLVYLTNIA